MGLLCKVKDDSKILASSNEQIVMLFILACSKLKVVQVKNEGESRTQLWTT